MDINNEKPLISRVGEMVRFVVDVQSFPDFESVQLFWFKNDIQIEKNHKHLTTGVKTDGQFPQTYLEIKSIELEDSGTYMLVSCLIINSMLQLFVSNYIKYLVIVGKHE